MQKEQIVQLLSVVAAHIKEPLTVTITSEAIELHNPKDEQGKEKPHTKWSLDPKLVAPITELITLGVLQNMKVVYVVSQRDIIKDEKRYWNGRNWHKLLTGAKEFTSYAEAVAWLDKKKPVGYHHIETHLLNFK